LCRVLAGAAVLLVCAAPAGRGDQPATAPASIADFFRPGVVLLDTNGDGAIDFVNARIVLAEHPSAAELASAANISARLGFETSAMNLPLPRRPAGSRSGRPAGAPRDDGPSVFVGSAPLAAIGVTAASIGGGALKPGEGLVAAIGTAARPVLAVLGGDDQGLAAAAMRLAGHLPLLWDQKGPTLETVASDVTRYLTEHGVSGASAGVS